MATSRLTFLFIVTISLFTSCSWLATKRYKTDKTSPNGTYRVKVDVQITDEGDWAGHFTEQGKIQIFKSQETIYHYDWNYRDNWEPTFINTSPSIEWVGDNVLRMGGETSRQLFSDELIILNNTDEPLKHVGVGCGKYEQFQVFDIAPHGQITLHTFPGLNQDVSGDYSLGYDGETQSGKKFEGVLSQKQPNSSLRLQITVNAKDLK
jgi:hypothetical protein